MLTFSTLFSIFWKTLGYWISVTHWIYTSFILLHCLWFNTILTCSVKDGLTINYELNKIELLYRFGYWEYTKCIQLILTKWLLEVYKVWTRYFNLNYWCYRKSIMIYLTLYRSTVWIWLYCPSVIRWWSGQSSCRRGAVWRGERPAFTATWAPTFCRVMSSSIIML